jgi:dihydrofolate reductase
MSKLIYTSNVSLDGYIEDETGSFEWTVPDEEYHRHINDREREVGTYLYGRRIYETMAVWETDPSLAVQSAVMADYAHIWQSADKIVFSSTLQSPATAKTRIERRFDPEAVRRLVETSGRDVSIAGAELAAHAFKAGLVDEVRLYVVPIIVGGGKPGLPRGVFLKLELLEEHRFDSGVVHLRYRIAR